MSELLAIEGPLLSSLAGKKRSNDEAVGEIEEEVQVVAHSKGGATHARRFNHCFPMNSIAGATPGC